MKKQFIFLMVFLSFSISAFGEETLGQSAFQVSRFQISLFSGKGTGFFQDNYAGKSAKPIYFEDDLGMTDSGSMVELEMGFNLAPKAQIYVSGMFGVFEGQKTLQNVLQHQDVLYANGTNLISFQEFGTVEIGLLLEVDRSENGSFSLGAGIRYLVTQSRVAKDQIYLRETTSSYETFLPTIRSRGDLRIFGFTFLYFDGTLGGFSYENKGPHTSPGTMNYRKKKVLFFKFQGGLKFALLPGMDFFLGYFYQKTEIYGEKNLLKQQFDFAFSGITLSFEMNF